MAPLLALIVGVLLSATAPTAGAEPVPSCDWLQTFQSEIRALDGDLSDWRIADVPRYGKVSYDEGVARIDPATPCHYLAETIKHEWLHLQQARVYGDSDAVHDHYHGEDDERVADCGAALLGSRVTPYIDPVWDYPWYIGPCRWGDIVEAWWLIAVGVTDGTRAVTLESPTAAHGEPRPPVDGPGAAAGDELRRDDHG